MRNSKLRDRFLRLDLRLQNPPQNLPTRTLRNNIQHPNTALQPFMARLMALNMLTNSPCNIILLQTIRFLTLYNKR